MQFTTDDLEWIYDRTSGYCHICHKKLSFVNYGCYGDGAWEVEHSNPRACGGSDRLCNLFAACISCNRSKGRCTTRTARRRNGKTRSPLNRQSRRSAKRDQAILGALGGGLLGALFGPVGTLVGAGLGAALNQKGNPDRR